MKCVLVYKDGRRVDSDVGGGLFIIAPFRDTDFRLKERKFEMEAHPGLADEQSRPIEYVEVGVEDVDARTRRWQAERMVKNALASGVALPRYVLQGKYLGETDEEFAARIEILRPAVEGASRRQSEEPK